MSLSHEYFMSRRMENSTYATMEKETTYTDIIVVPRVCSVPPPLPTF